MTPIQKNWLICRNANSRSVDDPGHHSGFDFAAPIKYIFAVFFEPYPSGFDEEET